MLSFCFNKSFKRKFKACSLFTEFFRKCIDSLGNLIKAMEMDAYIKCYVNFQQVQGRLEPLLRILRLKEVRKPQKTYSLYS